MWILLYQQPLKHNMFLYFSLVQANGCNIQKWLYSVDAEILFWAPHYNVSPSKHAGE